MSENKQKLIVEVAMEIALTPELLDGIAAKTSPAAARQSAMTTSVGGIGPLLRERMIAEAELGPEVIGISLLYEKVWTQRWQAWGQLYLEKRKTSGHIKRVLEQCPFTLKVSMYDGSVVEAAVWKTAYGKATVYFLEAPAVANVVYPGVEDAPPDVKDRVAWYEESRIKHSWLLGRGALELLRALGKKPDTIILSETPTLFAWHRLVKDGLTDEPLFAGTRYVFNDHTPLEYAHPVWKKARLKSLRIDPSFYEHLKTSQKKSSMVDITQMIVAGVDKVYGVARIHGEVMKAMPSLKPYADKIQTITNGVSIPYWQNPRLKDTGSLSDLELLRIKAEEKELLIDWVWKRFKLWSVWRDRALKTPLILWTRRITAYKRLDILTTMIRNAKYRERFLAADVTILLGGRIHQQDGISKQMVYDLLDFLSQHPEVEDRIAMLDDYNVWEAPRLFRGIDATIMMSDKGKEASATGFMKAQLNGGLVIASPDGAIPESVIFEGKAKDGEIPNGFEIVYRKTSPTPETFLDAIESFVRVCRDEKKRASMIRSAVSMAPRISVEKTARKMLQLFEK